MELNTISAFIDQKTISSGVIEVKRDSDLYKIFHKHTIKIERTDDELTFSADCKHERKNFRKTANAVGDELMKEQIIRGFRQSVGSSQGKKHSPPYYHYTFSLILPGTPLEL